LDIRRIIFSKIWKQIEPRQGFAVINGELLLDFSLHYLIWQYGKFKSQTRNQIRKVYVGWTGRKLERKIYIFTYGPINLAITPLIPNFMCKEKLIH